MEGNDSEKHIQIDGKIFVWGKMSILNSLLEKSEIIENFLENDTDYVVDIYEGRETGFMLQADFELSTLVFSVSPSDHLRFFHIGS